METRKNKNANLENKRSLFLELGFVIALSLALIAFEWTSQPKAFVDLGNLEDEDFEDVIVPITREKELKPPPPPVPPEKISIVGNDDPVEKELFIPGVEASEGTEIVFVPYDPPVEQAEDDSIFISVEEMPKFQGGGLMKFRKYVQSHLQYPPVAAQSGISGRVTISFVVDKTGNITQVKVYSGTHPALDEEAMRVIENAPDWTPGKQRDKKVNVAFYLPVTFVLQ